MTLAGLVHRLKHSALARAARDKRGAAAVEMAIITPVMISLFVGTSEVSTGFAVDRKVTLTARTVSDLVAQSTSVSNSDMTNIFSAASSIMMPNPLAPLKQRVSTVNINASGTATIGWSDGQGMSPRSPGSAASIPAALRIPNTQLVWGEVSYDFQPPFAKYITGTLTLSDQFFARPRHSNTVCRPPVVTTCS